MTDQTNPIPKFHALLIGVDCYLPNRLSDGSSYRNLRGCVRDINHLEAYLLNTRPETQILKLTASNVDGSITPKEPPKQLPTYINIVEKFQELSRVAENGDFVYIHYSGHGGRTKTKYPKLKGDDGVDEALVPTDIGTKEGQYFRDIELAHILKKMVDKGLVVTIVLDSCHSGGATKGVDSDIRGLDVVDETLRPIESLVASSEELVATWESLTKGTRNVTAASGWLPEQRGYTLLAACRDNEFAYEYAFDGKERNGALTYWLLDSLKKLGTGVTYKVLHDRLLAKIHSQFERQVPMLQGERDRLIFGSNSVDYQLAIPVIQVDLAQKRVQLQAGEANGVLKGAEFAIYSLGTADIKQTNKRVALVQITELGAVDSWAEIKQVLGENQVENIEQGATALLLHPSVKLVRKVRLLPTKSALPELEIAKPTVEGNAWIEFVSGDENSDEAVAYQVSVNEKGEYEILDPGGKPIANLQPVLKVGDPDAAANVVNRLVHLSKYQAVLLLDNNDPVSALAGKIKVELCKAGDNRELKPFDKSGKIPTLNVDEFAYLKIRNESSQTLNITVLAIQPDWSIGKLHPIGADFVILEAGRQIKPPIRFRTSLPEGYQEGADVLKVFATVAGTSFDWLKLPALGEHRTGVEGRRPSNPLEDLIAAISDENPANRNVSPAAYPSDEWTTEQVKLIVKKI
ncbi:caspase family protein [Anabaena catenula]|uniref:Caspase family protein n=1 Tax=Anabaena catenula FACHB-362 TaxID=2692877 RepID=A0ABR8JC63_9NOST|nr:caspase family protein [Anabaena catenula]MBD2694909.1 caspase family protein [Anabaena catenula FACHB-362]